MPFPNIFKLKISHLLVLIAVLALMALFDGELVLALGALGAGRSEFLARAGYWLGHGAVQVIFVGLIWYLGRRLARPALKTAGLQALAAFALSGLSTQLLKHLIGRPRPRLWSQGVTHFGPTLAEGLDSFPSGHTATAVAVALVLSFRYPGLAPLLWVWASFVAAARLLSGSHYPLDVLGGVLLGLAAGWSVLEIFRRAAPTSLVPEEIR